MPHRFCQLAFLSLALVLGACSSTVADDPVPNNNGKPSPTPEDEGIGFPAGPSCTPEITGLVPTAQKAITIDCPTGWTHRDGTTPISGRFKSREELVDALCIAIDETSDPRATNEDLGVDFTKSDVFAIPYDATARSLPLVNRRSSSEIWIRVTGSCSSGTKATFATALFLVPKEAKVDEQRCSVFCE